MAKYNVQVVKFANPISELGPKVGNTTILGPYTPGWSGVVDEDARIMLLKIRKPDLTGKTITQSCRVPFEAIQYYEVTAASVKDAAGEPPEPK